MDADKLRLVLKNQPTRQIRDFAEEDAYDSLRAQLDATPDNDKPTDLMAELMESFGIVDAAPTDQGDDAKREHDTLVETVLTLVRLHVEGKDKDFVLYAYRVARRSSNHDFVVLLKALLPHLDSSPLRNEMDGEK